jgi:asparagine synthetase B (glutamine-hydrolysing)
MLNSTLKIKNLCWNAAGFGPDTIDDDLAPRLAGRFSSAHRDGDRIVLTRDALGLNKLFFAYDATRGVVAANYVTELLDAGFPLPRIYAVPAGVVVTVDLHQRSCTTVRYAALPPSSGSDRAVADILDDVAAVLSAGFEQLARAHPDTPVAVCLSGGADSAVIALLARRWFPHAVAYTYLFTGDGTTLSDDAQAARTVASAVGIGLRLVPADQDTIMRSLEHAIVYGQDWRDFNVHAAIVNDILATAIAADHPTGPPPLVLTGDLMNELLGDYTPVHYAGTVHYPLPDIPPSKLRISLTRGLQAGDREVGVFAAHGLDVAQPYGWAYKQLLQLPNPVTKPGIIRVLAGGDLADEIVQRPKVRAQIGDHDTRQGILPLLLHTGHDAARLADAFCRIHRISDIRHLHQFLRGGVYRPPPDRM